MIVLHQLFLTPKNLTNVLQKTIAQVDMTEHVFVQQTVQKREGEVDEELLKIIVQIETFPRVTMIIHAVNQQ
ncbi:hypothetical protein GW750_08235 [bacterium]|nr:hypothetical protein [bacterium]